jgi:release factor glutamine methyltransferase
LSGPADETRVWTVLELIRASAEYLQQKGVASPRLDAELLLAHVLDLDRLKLYLDAARPVVPHERARYRELVKARGERVPLQRLTGEAHVLDLAFTVRDGVFVPRHETESLVLACLEKLGPDGPSRLVEVGTGTGCVGITLLKRWPQARAEAFEVDPAAAVLTRENAARHGVLERLILHDEDGLARDLPACELLVSNPPYVASADIEALEPEVSRHDPRAALDGGPEGLDAIAALVSAGTRCLADGGWLVFEHGADQASPSRDLLTAAGYVEVGSQRDLAERWRVTCGRRPLA